MLNCHCCEATIQAYDTSCPNCRALTKDAESKLPYGFPQLWRIRFDLIEKAGGVTLPTPEQITGPEMARIKFNIWAFLFGPLYYLFKGMWKKATVRWLPGAAAVFLLGYASPDGIDFVTFIVTIATAVWCARRANVDYYSKIVLGDNGW